MVSSALQEPTFRYDKRWSSLRSLWRAGTSGMIAHAGRQESLVEDIMVVVAVTERLELREFSVDDAEGFYALNADAEVLRYTGDVPFADIAEARAFLRAYYNYARDGFGRWSLYLRDSGEYLGFCGLNRRTGTGEVDVGFRLRRDCWGRGYATEAARAALDIGFTCCGLTRIVGRFMRGNNASQRVLEKLGMSFSHEVEQDGVGWVVYQVESAYALTPQPPSPNPGRGGVRWT